MKPEFANLKPGQSMENISYEDAIELFKLPGRSAILKERDYHWPVVLDLGVK